MLHINSYKLMESSQGSWRIYASLVVKGLRVKPFLGGVDICVHRSLFLLFSCFHQVITPVRHQASAPILCSLTNASIFFPMPGHSRTPRSLIHLHWKEPLFYHQFCFISFLLTAARHFRTIAYIFSESLFCPAKSSGLSLSQSVTISPLIMLGAQWCQTSHCSTLSPPIKWVSRHTMWVGPPSQGIVSVVVPPCQLRSGRAQLQHWPHRRYTPLVPSLSDLLWWELRKTRLRKILLVCSIKEIAYTECLNNTTMASSSVKKRKCFRGKEKCSAPH